MDPRHIFGEERQILPEKCSAHIIAGSVKAAAISAGALAPALARALKHMRLRRSAAPLHSGMTRFRSRTSSSSRKVLAQKARSTQRVRLLRPYFERYLAMTIFLFALLIFGLNSRLEAAPLKIATTILPISDMVKSIAGEKTEIVTILPPGANPHMFELTPQLIKKLDGSALIFRIGKGFDDWIAGVFDHLPESRLVQLDKGIQLINHDPHYWLSIQNAKEIVRTIADELIEIDVLNKSLYEANLKRYLEELDQADQHIKDELSSLPNKKIITFHNGWCYLARDYGLEIVATVESSEGSEPTPKRLTQLQHIVRDHQIRVLFTEPTVAQSLAHSIAYDFNLRVIELDPLGNKKENQTFIKLMLHNADDIEEALA